MKIWNSSYHVKQNRQWTSLIYGFMEYPQEGNRKDPSAGYSHTSRVHTLGVAT